MELYFFESNLQRASCAGPEPTYSVVKVEGESPVDVENFDVAQDAHNYAAQIAEENNLDYDPVTGYGSPKPEEKTTE